MYSKAHFTFTVNENSRIAQLYMYTFMKLQICETINVTFGSSDHHIISLEGFGF